MCVQGSLLLGGRTQDKKISKAVDSSTRRVTYPESYIIKYTTYTEIKSLYYTGEVFWLAVDCACNPAEAP